MAVSDWDDLAWWTDKLCDDMVDFSSVLIGYRNTLRCFLQLTMELRSSQPSKA